VYVYVPSGFTTTEQFPGVEANVNV
jgi:hypothetical protein